MLSSTPCRAAQRTCWHLVRIVCRGRDVYIMGAANVGKSAFVRALIKEMSSSGSINYDSAALTRAKRLPVESAMPGTTLQTIPMQAFASGGLLYGEGACYVGVPVTGVCILLWCRCGF